MKKILILLFFFVFLFVVIYCYKIFTTKTTPKKNIDIKNSKKVNSTSEVTKSTSNIFVPYWNVPKDTSDLSNYDKIYYFSLTTDTNGLNKTNQNWEKMSDFLELQTKNKYLTISMLDFNQNLDILKDVKWQQKIIEDTIIVTKKSVFSGVVLDLEMSPSLSKNTPDEITEFIKDFYKSAKENNLEFYITLYGDVFYRARPYDVKALEKYCDKFLIMTYDLHKPSGEPGPNFPLEKGDKYPYDLKTLNSQLLQLIPPQKIEYIFGMYGYNWVVDETKKPIKPAKSMSFLDIKKSYLDTCEWENCVIKRDELSGENEVDYIDEFLNYRIVWYEDKESVDRKIKYLKTTGISNFSFWTLGYF
jgi:spore germination protein YaaH